MTEFKSTPRNRCTSRISSGESRREPTLLRLQREGAPFGGRWVHFDPVATPYAFLPLTLCAMLHAGVVYRARDLRWMSHGANSERTCRSGAQAYNADSARTDRPTKQ